MPYKSPLELANAIQSVPPYSKEKTIAYLEQFGDHVTDEAYEDWAKKQNKKIGPREPITTNPEVLNTSYFREHQNPEGSYRNQYLKDDFFLKDFWENNYDAILGD